MLKKNNTMRKEKNYRKYAIPSLRVVWEKEEIKDMMRKKSSAMNSDFD